eukprot:4257742-Prymnesium_polylepis.1
MLYVHQGSQVRRPVPRSCSQKEKRPVGARDDRYLIIAGIRHGAVATPADGRAAATVDEVLPADARRQLRSARRRRIEMERGGSVERDEGVHRVDARLRLPGRRVDHAVVLLVVLLTHLVLARPRGSPVAALASKRAIVSLA